MNEVAVKRVSMKDAYLRFWMRWGDYKGRSSRQEYWKWFLVNAVICLFVGILSPVLGKSLLIACYSAFSGSAWAITMRRLHDAGHTGKWLMPGATISVILVVVLVGSLTATRGTVTTIPPIWVIAFAVLLVVLLADAITIFVFLCQRSVPDNAWGPAPQRHKLSCPRSSDLSGVS